MPCCARLMTVIIRYSEGKENIKLGTCVKGICVRTCVCEKMNEAYLREESWCNSAVRKNRKKGMRICF